MPMLPPREKCMPKIKFSPTIILSHVSMKRVSLSSPWLLFLPSPISSMSLPNKSISEVSSISSLIFHQNKKIKVKVKTRKFQVSIKIQDNCLLLSTLTTTGWDITCLLRRAFFLVMKSENQVRQSKISFGNGNKPLESKPEFKLPCL